MALVHDWLTGMRGGEKALEVLCERFPRPRSSRWCTSADRCRPLIERLRIHTSFIQRLPGVGGYYRHCLPLFPTAVEAIRPRSVRSRAQHEPLLRQSPSFAAAARVISATA